MITSMLEQQAECYEHVLRPRLGEHGVHLTDWEDLTNEQREELSTVFDTEISAVLTPLSLDEAHPFPYVSNLSTSWAFRLEDPVTGESVLVRVKVPRELPQWLRVRTGVAAPERVFVSLDQVIAANANKLFPGMAVARASLFRVCRDAEVEVDEEDDGVSKRAIVEREVLQRRFEPVVRLEIQPGRRSGDGRRAARAVRAHVGGRLRDERPARLHDAVRDRRAGARAPARPTVDAATADRARGGRGDIFAAIRAGDIMLHQPYDSFYAGVERFISEAADDPLTVSIKMTVYRVGDDTPFVQSLIRAAEAGKQVACVIELNARFDEERNLHWSRELEKVGAHVVFGVSGLKTHSKTALVVRKEDSGMRCYAHIATGNYHTRTARLYEDVGLLTADPAITGDIVTLFHFLTGRSRTPSFSTLLVAPMNMRARFIELIEREIENHQAGRPARIICKMNQLEDPEICAAALTRLAGRASRST